MRKMVEVVGKHSTAKIFTENFDDNAYKQIETLCDQPFAERSKIRIMPDVHAGSGCVIGFTADLGDKVIPNIVGVDIGCGMLVAELGDIDVDLKKLDDVIHKAVPAGMSVHSKPMIDFPDLEDLVCRYHLRNVDWILRSLGTLGGGNHFIELDVDDEGEKYLVIHTGSRNLGKQVAEYYQKLAISNIRGKNQMRDTRAKIIERLKSEGREKNIENELRMISSEVPEIPNELCYLEGGDMTNYLHDMRICQDYATMNRHEILRNILSEFNLRPYRDCIPMFTTAHNYIGNDGIIRKGAVSAKLGEKLIIPLNMRDGSLICVGKGNEDWNCSAPHGAGRLYSRTEARRVFDIKDYQKQMDGIYTTSANEDTIDECPMAYKPAQSIIDSIGPTVDIVKRIRPIYNFKAGE